MPTRPPVTGFTIIELLVVVTIIVILLALLTPAMDKAIYQAELTVCGANERGVAMGVLSYASEMRHRYPHRKASGSQVQANVLAYPGVDDRPLLEGYVDLRLLVCPLTAEIDLINTPADPTLYPSYSLYYGWRFIGALGGKGMYRQGDRLEFDGNRFNVLLIDWDRFITADKTSYTTHPDAQNRAFNWQLHGSSEISAWLYTGADLRGTIDLNAAYDDGSVQTFDDVRYNEWTQGGKLRRAPDFANEYEYQNEWYVHLPRE